MRHRIVHAALALVLSACAATHFLARPARFAFLPAHDIYAYFYPKMLYAAASLAAGWGGLLWNPFQNCGEPFFALSQTGLLYPPHWLFALVEPDIALRAVIVVNQMIAGVATYLLARDLGARPAAALSGMLVLQLGTTLPVFSTLATPHLGAYAWLPVVLLAGERLLAAPGAWRATQLAAALAFQLLPGSPQIVFLTVQLLVLRLLWELVTVPGARRAGTVGWMGVGLLLGISLAAAQLVPEIEAANVSLRGTQLSPSEAEPLGSLDWPGLVKELTQRGVLARPVVIGLVPLVLGAIVSGRLHRRGMFYATVAVLYGTLAFGGKTPLFGLYLLVPGATMFRFASRLLWVSGFCFALLVALAVDALTASRERAAGGGKAAVVSLALLGGGLVAVHCTIPGGLRPVEWMVGAVAVASGAAVLAAPRLNRWLGSVVLLAVGVELVQLPGFNARALLDHPDYWARRPALEALRALLSPQDRVYVVSRSPWSFDYSLTPKTASLFRIPSADDYEPLLSERYAAFEVRLRSGRPMIDRRQAIYPVQIGSYSNRRLLDLTAVRWVLADEKEAGRVETMTPPLLRRLAVGGTLVFENPTALPRAFYVRRIQVVQDAAALLDRLARGEDDLRSLALVETAPSSGFTGLASGNGVGRVAFSVDEPTRVELSVDATEPGFLVLIDQYYPGWSATVDGLPAQIVRANYAFRVVEVPAGASKVVFRYRPPSLAIGAATTALALLVTGGILRAGAGRSRRRSHCT
jgi:hypothetical protein